MTVTFPEGTSAEAVYAILTWGLELHGHEMNDETRRAAQDALDESAKALYRNWCKQLMDENAPLCTWVNGRLGVAVGMLSQPMLAENGMVLLEALRARLSAPIEVVIPQEEACAPHLWSRVSSSFRHGFAQWARQKGKLDLPYPADMDRDGLLEVIEAARSAVECRGRILEFLKAYDQRGTFSEPTYRTLLDRAVALRGTLPEKLDLELIGDKSTKQLFEGICARLPDDILYGVLHEINEALALVRLQQDNPNCADASLTALECQEKRLSELLRSVQGDARFSNALKKMQRSVLDTVMGCGNLRSQEWLKRQRKLVAEQRFWEAYLDYREHRQQLQALAQSDMGLYALTMTEDGAARVPLALAIGRKLDESYLEALPKMAEFCFGRARQYREIYNKPGVSLAVCLMVQRMLQLPEGVAQPEGWTALSGEAENLRAQALASLELERSGMRRSVSIGDISSAQPGLGLTFARDLANHLQLLLDKTGMDQYVTLRDSGATPNKWEYVAHGGVVANFDGQEMTERVGTRTLRVVGEGRSLPNPDYDEEADANAPKAKLSRQLHVQEVRIQVVKVREIERIAHVRVFMNFRGPGLNKQIEVNEFYSRRFLLEESHPIEDVKLVETKKCYDSSELERSTPEAQLRYDRLWTPGEMLDWARQDSLHLLTLQIMFYINDYPLFLSDRAEKLDKDGKLADALDRLGVSVALCKATDLDTDYSRLLEFQNPPAAKAYDSWVEKLNRQRKVLQDFKRGMEDKLSEMAGRLMTADALKIQN